MDEIYASVFARRTDWEVTFEAELATSFAWFNVSVSKIIHKTAGSCKIGVVRRRLDR